MRRMPITTINELPHLRFPIGNTTTDGSILNLFDTGAALNTGQLVYHQALKNKRPDVIDSYEEFNGTNPFDPIKLCGAISDPSTYDTEKQGILSAVIRYKTPFIVDGHAYTIAFALGKDVTVNSIIGLPTITELQLEFRFRPDAHVISSIMERQFRVEFREASCSATDIINIDDDNLPPSIHEKSHTLTRHTTKDVSVDKCVRFSQSDMCPVLPPHPTCPPLRRPADPME